MRNLVALFIFSLFLLPAANAAEVTWSIGAGARYVYRKLDDGLNAKNNANENYDVSKITNKKFEFRGSVGALVKLENIDWGLDLRTQPSPVSEWITTAGTAGDFGAALGQAFGRYHRAFDEVEFAVTFGRAKTVLLYDNVVQALFDNDTRWDGFGWSFKHGMFGFNATQYVLGAVNQGVVGASSHSRTDASESDPQTQSHFATLFAFQPWAQFKFTEDLLSTLAVGYLNWSGTGGNTGGTAGTGFYTNAVHGGTANSSNSVAVGNVSPVIMDNASQWQVFLDNSFQTNFRFMGEYILNKKVFYGTRLNTASPAVAADRASWAVTIAYGKPKKAGDFYFGYSYGNKGIASVINTFTQGDIPADNLSHFLEGKYCVADGLLFVAKAQFHKEKAHLGGDGQPLAAPNAGRNQTQQRYEFVTTVSL